MAPKKRTKKEDWAETCTFFGTFIETRYSGYPVRVPPGDERTFYEAYCYCGLIDGDGMSCLLGQPISERRRMERSMGKLGLHKLVENVKRAAAALKKSGLSLGRKANRAALSALMRPFEDKYSNKLRENAYARLYRFIGSSRAFLPYALNCARMEKEGGNPFDPKEWTPEKMANL
jgi:hypothetical protein